MEVVQTNGDDWVNDGPQMEFGNKKKRALGSCREEYEVMNRLF